MSRLSLSLAAAAALSALGYATDTFTVAPVEVPAMQFQATLRDGRVHAVWRHYKPDDFLSYQLVKSSTSDSPMYPDLTPLFWTRDQDATDYVDGILSPGKWRYRLIIVTRFGQRWASPVVVVTIHEKDVRRPTPTSADFELPTN